MLEPTLILDERSSRSTKATAFRAVLKRAWPLDDVAGAAEPTLVPAGTYELERVPPPAGHTGHWLQLKGTQLGWPEQRWNDWRSPDYGSFQILVTPIELSEETRRTRAAELVARHVSARALMPLEIEDTEPSDMREALAISTTDDSAVSEDEPTRISMPIEAEPTAEPPIEITARMKPPQPMTVAATAPGYGRSRRRPPRSLRFGGLRFRLF